MLMCTYTLYYSILPVVSVGRLLMSIVGVSQAPDIYTAAIGLYSVWLFVRAASTLMHYTSQGLSSLTSQISIWTVQVSVVLLYEY